MFSLLRRVRNETKPSMKRRLGILGRRRLLRDLEDYCIMATEHFNDEIAPGFNKAQHQEDAESMLDMREMSNTVRLYAFSNLISFVFFISNEFIMKTCVINFYGKTALALSLPYV